MSFASRLFQSTWHLNIGTVPRRFFIHQDWVNCHQGKKEKGKEMHELKANEELQSLKGIFVPMKPETVEGLEHIRLRQVSRAFAKRIILPNL